MTRNLLLKRQIRPDVLLLSTVIAHTAILAVAAGRGLQDWTQLTFAITFALSGLCTGAYFPLAAGQLAESGIDAGSAGSKLEMADHIGAAAGAFLTGLVIVPVVGTRLTLFTFILLMLVNVLLGAVRLYIQPAAAGFVKPAFIIRKSGYILFGFGLCIILWSNMIARAAASLSPPLPIQAVVALAKGLEFEQTAAAIGGTGTQVDYFKLYDSEKQPAGYVFSTEDFAPDVRGFGGEINLAVRVDASGELIDFHIIRSNETPAYLKLLTGWENFFKGRNLFAPGPFAGVDTVTGATVRSRAILLSLEESGLHFASEILDRRRRPATAQKLFSDHLPDTQAGYLIGAFVLALAVSFYGGFRSKQAVLLFSLIVGGIILNAQFSGAQIVNLISGHFPSPALSGVFLLAVVLPVVVVIFGNYYCGYICPFGAAQELLGFIIPQRLRHPLSKDAMHWGRFVKYILLFILICVFFISRDHRTLKTEPLIEVFSGNTQRLLLWISGISLVGSIFYVRFWCRYFCPVGAFLSLLNGLAVLKRYMPAKKFGRCEFGVTGRSQLDCISCDRCRFELQAAPEKKPAPPLLKSGLRLLSRYLLVPVVIMAVFISTVSITTFVKTLPAETALSTTAGYAGQVRDVDIQRIQTLIRQNKLSDREADFYKKTE